MSITPPDHYDDALAQRYLTKLKEAPSLEIVGVLKELNLGDSATDLETIVKADMSFRWQKLDFDGPVQVEQATYVKPPSVESYVEQFLQLTQADVQRRLVKWELALRQEIGDRPLLAEYSHRFPKLGDVNEWLLDNENEGGWAAGDDRLIGSTIGPYKIESKIGEGSLTVSYRAIQFRPVRDFVVIKFVKSEFDQSDIVGRFRFELSTLAVMDHDYIVNATDADVTGSGMSYFVMPWVDGVPVDHFVREEQMSLVDRLQLFSEICDAVQYAHVKGVIHRDLKPSNLLVSQKDQVVSLSVVDLGVVRAIGSRLGQRTVATHFGGTFSSLQYLSPEQASFSPLDIDTRSDVYSLGAILYELIAGQSPFAAEDLNSLAIDQTLRTIRQSQPDPPSERVPGLPMELDWIVARAMEKDREQRYQSPRELAADLRRYLGGQIVSVAPRSFSYWTGKFVRRNWSRILIPLTAIVITLGVVGLLIQKLGWIGQ